MATPATDIDCQSVASSTSWYMLNEPDKFPTYPVSLKISFNFIILQCRSYHSHKTNMNVL